MKTKALSLKEQAQFIQDELTQRLAAYCLKLESGKTLGQWTRGETKPSELMQFKIKKLIVLINTINSRDFETLHSWMLGLKDNFNDQSPAALLHKDFDKNFDKVYAEAMEFSNNN